MKNNIREKTLIKNTVIITIGTICTKLITFFLLPLYTGVLTTDEYGTVELFNTIISLLLPVICLQIDQGIFRFLIDNRQKKKQVDTLISTSFIFLCFISILLFFVFLILSFFINNKYKWLLFINLIFANFSSFFMQISRGLGDNKKYSIASFIIAFATIIFNIFFLIGIHLKVDGMLYGSAVGYFIGCLYLYFGLNIYKFVKLKYFSVQYLKKLLKYSLPMIPNSISWWIFSSSDRIIISSYVGLSATGLLSVAYKFSNIAIVVYNIFNMSLTESIALHINDEDIINYYNKTFNSVGHLFTTFGSLLIAFMPIIFMILINKNYIGAYNLIPLAIMATVFQVYVGMLGTIYVAKNNTKSIAISSIIAAIINITSDLLLVKYISTYAAIVSTLISFITLFIYRIIDVNKKYFKVDFCIKLLFNLIVSIFCVCIIYYFKNMYTIIVNIIIASFCALIFNKNNLKFISNLIKERRKKI